MARETKTTNTKIDAASSKITKSAKKPKTMNPPPRRRRPTTTHKLVWRHVTCRVKHVPDYMSQGWSHIEIIVQSPKDAPIPITQTGYLSHFLDEDELVAAGGPVAFFLAWMDREARTPAWAKADNRWRQLELFPR
jgi:hypothetical protein